MRRVMGTVLCGLLLTGACAMAQTGAEYLDITRVNVRGEKTKEFEDAIKKMSEVNRKYKGDRWVTLTREYGDFGGYMFTSTRANFAEVETGMGAFQKAMKEGLGPLADKLMHDLYADSASGRSEIRHRRWDLSVNAPSGKEDYLKTVAQTRWIRVLTTNLKPGYTREYIDGWKPFQAELQKDIPGAAIWVSESSTGAPATFTGVYYKSWAEMDEGAAGLQKALASPAYQQLMAATRNAVASSTWEIYHIRPELSCPPDEIVQADPAFWKPKPAPAAAPKPKTDGAEKK
jgi:hypothetical protein